jgi:hypothetical protein
MTKRPPPGARMQGQGSVYESGIASQYACIRGLWLSLLEEEEDGQHKERRVSDSDPYGIGHNPCGTSDYRSLQEAEIQSSLTYRPNMHYREDDALAPLLSSR